MLKKTLLLAALIVPALHNGAWAQMSREAAPPPKVEPIEEPDELEPDVTISSYKGEPAEEYRVRGKLYMIKVTPVVGPVYYLVDENGDGSFVRNDSMPTRGIKPPRWVLFRW